MSGVQMSHSKLRLDKVRLKWTETWMLSGSKYVFVTYLHFSLLCLWFKSSRWMTKNHLWASSHYSTCLFQSNIWFLFLPTLVLKPKSNMVRSKENWRHMLSLLSIVLAFEIAMLHLNSSTAAAWMFAFVMVTWWSWY